MDNNQTENLYNDSLSYTTQSGDINVNSTISNLPYGAEDKMGNTIYYIIISSVLLLLFYKLCKLNNIISF
jgi:hypothetical protein